MFNSDQLGRLSDRELLAESRAYEGYITSNMAKLNLTQAEVDAIKAVNDKFETTLDQWDAVQLNEAGISENKKGDRSDVLGELRGQRNRVYADSSVNDAERASAGMPPRDKVKTDAPAATTAPIGWMDFAKLKITVHFRDSATPDSKAKPDGQDGCQLWEFIGDAPPVSEEDFRYLATDSNSPYVRYYEMKDAGKRVFFLLRWVSTKGETGAWSEMLEGNING